MYFEKFVKNIGIILIIQLKQTDIINTNCVLVWTLKNSVLLSFVIKWEIKFPVFSNLIV